MSILIMSRLFKAQLGSSSRKMLAVRLADFADDEGKGIWPSVERLAQETELSDRTVQRLLADFVKDGLLVVVKKASGRPGEATRYDFDMAALNRLPDAKSPVETGDTVSPVVASRETGDTMSRVTPDAETGDTDCGDGCHHVTRTVIEPPIEPSSERDARERVQEDDRKTIEREFWRLVKNWPGFDGMPKEPARAPFFALTPDERAEAIDRFPAWMDLLKAQRKSHVPAPSTYLKEMLWKDVPKAAQSASTASVPNSFSRAWHARRLHELLQPMNTAMPAMTIYQRKSAAAGGEEARKVDLERREKYGWPKVNTMHQRAANAQGVTVSPRLSLISDSFEKAHKDGELAAAWQRFHQRHGWPWMAVPDQIEWLYFPPTNSETGDIDVAVAEAMAEFQAQVNEGRENDAA